MRIGLESTSLLGPRAGVGNYTGRLLAALLRAEPNWEYLLYSNRQLSPLEASLAGARPMISRVAGKRSAWMQCLLPFMIRRSQPDVCHFPNAMAPLVTSKPSVLTIHDASLFVHRQFHPAARLLSIRLLLPVVARRAAAIITVSHHARQDLIRILKLDPAKVHVIYEAAPEHFAPVSDPARLQAVRSKFGLPERFILYVGTLEPRKNLERLVRAYHELRRHGCREKLVLVGAEGWKVASLFAEIERLSLQSDVLLTGYVGDQDLAGIFSLAAVFAYPSLFEGFGLPPLEAMACGTPVLTSGRASLPEVCGDAAYYVDPEDETSIADGLCRLLADAEYRHELTGRGQLRASTFSWERTARETMAVYQAVCAPALASDRARGTESTFAHRA